MRCDEFLFLALIVLCVVSADAAAEAKKRKRIERVMSGDYATPAVGMPGVLPLATAVLRAPVAISSSPLPSATFSASIENASGQEPQREESRETVPLRRYPCRHVLRRDH